MLLGLPVIAQVFDRERVGTAEFAPTQRVGHGLTFLLRPDHPGGFLSGLAGGQYHCVWADEGPLIVYVTFLLTINCCVRVSRTESCFAAQTLCDLLRCPALASKK